MAYADSLPQSILRCCKWFNAGCLLLTLLVCVDVFLLPRSVQKEKIIARELHYLKTRSRYSSRPHEVYLDGAFIITENYRYAYTLAQNFDPGNADSIQLIATPVFKIVDTGFVKTHGIKKELKRGAGMFSTLMFLPIAFGLIAVFGVAMHHNKEQLFNAAVMNMLLIIIQLYISGYLG